MIRNLNTDRIISQHVVEAKSVFGRMRGMLGRNFDDFDAMLFRKNSSIHMWFVAFPLDIVFLDKDDNVISIRHSLNPWRMAADFDAAHVLELPAGKLEETGTSLGDKLEITVDANV